MLSKSESVADAPRRHLLDLVAKYDLPMLDTSPVAVRRLQLSPSVNANTTSADVNVDNCAPVAITVHYNVRYNSTAEAASAQPVAMTPGFCDALSSSFGGMMSSDPTPTSSSSS